MALALYSAQEFTSELRAADYRAAELQARQAVAAGSLASWLGTGLGLFLVGWVIQFIGHAFEGRKPAFVDDLIGAAFKVKNPQAKASCGCGTSFTA